jgi:hypothetical protein
MLAMTALVTAQTDANSPYDTSRLLVENPLNDGDVVGGVLRGNVTARLYGFNGTRGNRVRVTLYPAQGSDTNPYLILLGNRGQLLAQHDDLNAGGLFRRPNRTAQINFELPYDGSYLILASTPDLVDGLQLREVPPNVSYPFVLELIGNRPPADSTGQILLAGEDLQNGQPFDGVSNTAEPIYYFSFEGQSNRSVTLSMSSVGMDSVLYLFDPHGNRITFNDDFNRAEIALINATDAAIVSYVMPFSGRYLAFATDINLHRQTGYVGGQFTITLNPPR